MDHDLVGREGPVVTRSWTVDDVLLYALGVGAGIDDPAQELSFTTENSLGIELQVLPTFGVLLAHTPLPDLGDLDRTAVVHAEQGFTLLAPIPVCGTVTARTRVTGVHDKGSGALVMLESTATAPTGELLVTCRSSIFVRGAGGFGGDPAPPPDPPPPHRLPDRTVTYTTRPEQALLYRLSGDRNPLHSDPKFAAQAGFERAILHGLCTFGVTGRALLHEIAGSNPTRLCGMSGRFSAIVRPGEALTVEIWRNNDAHFHFRTRGENGQVVIDRGQAALRPR